MQEAREDQGINSLLLDAHRAKVFGALFTKPPLRRFGRYIVLDVLGHGGMGIVFKGYDDELDRQVALKVLHTDPTGHHGPRLKREAKALARLAHPNVVQVYEVSEAEGRLFVAMELIKGQTLRQWQNDGESPREWRDCVEVYVQAGQGLAAAHAKGLVHRDFKPGNVILDEEGRTRVLDFGLARRAKEGGNEQPSLVEWVSKAEEDTEASLTKTGVVLGTPAYMPPEQIRGQEADARSDQFSFCVSLYEAVYGNRPFEGTTIAELMLSTMRGDVRPASKGSKVPAALRAILLRGLAADPEQRWPSMDDLLAQLHALAAPRFRRFVGMSAGVVLVAATLAALVIVRKNEELHAKDEVITDNQAEIQRQLVQLQDKERRLVAELNTQKSLRVKMMAGLEGHELEAVNLAIEAFGDFNEQTDDIPSSTFEGLTHALTEIRSGIVLHGHEREVVAVAYSSDGRYVATASWDKSVRLWDASSGAPLRTFKGHTEPVLAVAFSPDGAYIATTSKDGTARTWGVATGELLDTLPHGGPVYHVAFSPSGEGLATTSGNTAWLWNMNTDAIVMPFVGHSGLVRNVAFSPDGTQLVTASDDQTSRIWDAATGSTIATLEGHAGPIDAVAVSSSGEYIATASRDQTARLWDATTGVPLISFPHDDVVYAVALSPSGTHLVTSTFDDCAAHLWDIAEVRRLTSFHHAGPVVDVAISPHGRQLTTASWDGTAASWELDPGGPITVIQAHSARVDAVTFSPEGARFATAGGDGTARIWDAYSGALLAIFRGHGVDVLDVAFSPDGSHIATSSWDGTARIWDAYSTIPLSVLEGHTGPVLTVAFSPDGTRVATTSRDGTVRIWGATTGEELRSLSHNGPVIDAVFAPNGRRLLTIDSDETIRVWNAATGEPLSAFPHESPAALVAFSADGERIAAAMKDYSIRSWYTESGESATTFRGHSAPIHAMEFSRDGMGIATASEDGTARVWDSITGQSHAVFPHEGPVDDVTFSPDGTRIATVSRDQMVRLWMLEPQPWLTWGCAVLDGRQAHTDLSRRACPPTMANAKEVEGAPDHAEPPLVSPTHAAALETKVITVHDVEFVRIPRGTFMMGSPHGEGLDQEHPQHEVTLSTFYLARTELTNAQYSLYLEANPDAPKPGFWGDERYNHPEQPVVALNWHEAKAYCDWAGFSLPTEAQWEYAARAGAVTSFWFGENEDDLDRFGWYEDNSGDRAHTVRTKGANPFGLYGVHGNIFEWCLDDWVATYDGAVHRPGDGLRLQSPGDATRVVRGGAWFIGPHFARSAFRDGVPPAFRGDFVGFRPALQPPELIDPRG